MLRRGSSVETRVGWAILGVTIVVGFFNDGRWSVVALQIAGLLLSAPLLVIGFRKDRRALKERQANASETDVA